jgi:hypothetical protein
MEPNEALAMGGALAETNKGQIDRWLREYMRGGPDRRRECKALGATAGAIEKATEARRQWDADQARWLTEEVGEDALDRPVTAKGFPAVHDVSGAAGVSATLGATSSPSSPMKAAQAEPLPSSAPVGAPLSGSVGVPTKRRR